MDKLRSLIIDLAGESLRQHNYCEDGWYSCPKGIDGCADSSAGDECNCGADQHNAKVSEVLIEILELMDRIQEAK